MSERRKTLVAAAALAAAVGVYMEVSYQEKLREQAKKPLDAKAAPAPASSVPRPPGTINPPK
jgi:hypothetical protein